MKKVVGLLVIFASGLIKLHAQHVQVGILGDLISAGISAEYYLDDRYAVGVESSIGYSTKATLSSAGYVGMMENLRMRMYISKKTRRNENIWGKTPDMDSGTVVLSVLHPVKWIWDIGITYSPAVMILDDSPKHGFSHMYATYGFVRLRRQLTSYFQLATTAGLGYNGEARIILGNIEARVVLPLHW